MVEYDGTVRRYVGHQEVLAVVPLVARWRVFPGDGTDRSFEFAVTSPGDVEELVHRLSSDGTDTAALEGPTVPGDDLPEHTLLVLVHQHHAYLQHDSVDGSVQSVGVPESPAVETDDAGWPAGSGFPVADLAAVLGEFASTYTRPASVQWVDLPSYALSS